MVAPLRRIIMPDLSPYPVDSRTQNRAHERSASSIPFFNKSEGSPFFCRNSVLWCQVD
jgi:hypothetical protein